jgi:hypothetical protein
MIMRMGREGYFSAASAVNIGADHIAATTSQDAKFQALLTICWDAVLIGQYIVEQGRILFHKGRRFSTCRHLAARVPKNV